MEKRLRSKKIDIKINDPIKSVTSEFPKMSLDQLPKEKVNEQPIINNNFQKVSNKINSNTQLMQLQKDLLKVYAVGGAEIGEFYIPYPQNSKQRASKTRRPICLSDLNQFTLYQDANTTTEKLTIYPNPLIKLDVFKVVCGGQHTLINTLQGKVFSWGSNDQCALGRQGEQSIPMQVKFNVPIDQLTAGDTHSCFVNSQNGLVFFCGTYKSTKEGFISQKIQTPTLVASPEQIIGVTIKIKHFKLKKVLSGFQHTLMLINDRIYFRGDWEYSASGRKQSARIKDKKSKQKKQGHINSVVQSFKFYDLGLKDVKNIWTGGRHCFAQVGQGESKRFYAWGCNSSGQLGIENDQDQLFPVQIEAFENLNIKKIVGGFEHSIALTEEGDVYGFGTNNYGQVGIGQDVIPEIHPKDNPQVIWKPTKLNLNNIRDIASGAHFSYALANQQGENNVYTWGLATSYVLINGSQLEDKFEPFKVPKSILNNSIVNQISAGGQHVIFTASVKKVENVEQQFPKLKCIVKKGKIHPQLQKIH